MKNTFLIEFLNQRKNALRGFLMKSSDNNDHVVVMLGGFERTSSSEKKFELLSNELKSNNIDSFRFDAASLGLSDGDFYQTTTQTVADDLTSAINVVRSLGYKKISFAGHSHAGCNLSLILKTVTLTKIVLMAPALNQKELFRLWFAQSENPNQEINWENYRKYLDETRFLKSLSTDMICEKHILGPSLAQTNHSVDYAVHFHNYDLNKILLIHGDSDAICPIESLTIKFPNKIIVENGDHDIDKPEIIKLWLKKAATFIAN